MNSNNHGRKSNRNSRRDRVTAASISIRRTKVAELLQTTSMTSYDIAKRLGVDDSTIRYDIRALKNQAVDFLYDLCKSDLCFFYRQTILDLDHARHICWQIINEENNSNNKITTKDRIQAARTIIQADQIRFELLSNGEGVLAAKNLSDRVDAITKEQEQTAVSLNQNQYQHQDHQQRRTVTA